VITDEQLERIEERSVGTPQAYGVMYLVKEIKTLRAYQAVLDQFVSQIDLADSYSGCPNAFWENLARTTYSQAKNLGR
jgi:hypothetical protein